MSESETYQLGLVIGGILVGVVCGLVPTLFAVWLKDFRLAKGSMISCALSGLILGIQAALPLAIILTATMFSRWYRASKKASDPHA